MLVPPVTMLIAAKLKTAFEAIFGVNGANLTDALNANSTNLNATLAGFAPPPAQPREYSVIKIEPFYGRDGEDPIDWLETFDRASITNQ